MPQTLGGTVTAISTVGTWTAYTLSLPSGSAFATLSGASAVTVYTNANTAPPPPTPFSTAPPIAVNSVVRFNGLVFSTGGGAFVILSEARQREVEEPVLSLSKEPAVSG